MGYEIEIKNVPPQYVATVRSHVAFKDIGPFVAAAFRRVGETIAASRLAVQGMPFAIYHTMNPETPVWDVQICFPVDRRFEPRGEVSGAMIDGATVASTVHRGPYDKIGPAYDAIRAFAKAQGRTLVGPPREIYLNDPGVAGMANAETQIDWPISDIAR